MIFFLTFYESVTDRPTDISSYRDARTHLKRNIKSVRAAVCRRVKERKRDIKSVRGVSLKRVSVKIVKERKKGIKSVRRESGRRVSGRRESGLRVSGRRVRERKTVIESAKLKSGGDYKKG